jgi:hypothetical protein
VSEGEFNFTLTERTDRNGDKYLFAGIRILNSVLFIRPEPEVAGRPKRWQAVLKPYRPKGDEDDYEAPWNEPLNNQQENDKQGENDERKQSPQPQRRPR